MRSSRVFELRQYRLRPGARDEFIAHFERHLIEPQQAAGMRLIGQFRDQDRPDVFVWIRGFLDMDQRARALESFYLGPVWREHRDVMNSMMIDSDDVLLLRALDPAVDPFRTGGGGSGVRIRIWLTRADGLPTTVARYREHISGPGGEAGERVIAELSTETAADTFPRLPVREGDFVFVAVTVLTAAERPDADGMRPDEALRLVPTEHSQLR